MKVDTAALLDELRVAVRHDALRARRRNRLVLFAAVLGVLAAVAGVAVAGTFEDWWTGAEPVVQPKQVEENMQESHYGLIDPDLSKKATVARTDDAALVAVATKSGGYCMSLFVGAKGLGTSCTSVADSEFRTRADDTHWLAYGRILDRDAAALDLSGAGLPANVPLERGGFFLFDLPRSQWPALNERHGDVSVLDASGRTLRRACIWVGEAPGSPVSGGGVLGDPGQCDVPPPVDPVPDQAKARRLVADRDVALWQAPSVDGRGTCWFTASAASPAPHVGLGAGSCRSNAEPAPTHELVSAGASGDLVTGILRPGTRIAKVTIQGDGWSVDATVANDAFIARVTGERPWQVVAYDAKGNIVSSVKLSG